MIPYSRTKLSDFSTLSQSKKPYPSQWHIPVYLYTDLPTPKRQKMPVSEPRAGKSSEVSEKWVKSREMFQTPLWRDFQRERGLWVLEVPLKLQQ